MPTRPPKSTTCMSPQQIVERERRRLAAILEEGLDAPSYEENLPGFSYNGDFEAFLCDYGPDFSWEPISSRVEFQACLDDPEWCRLAEQVKNKHGYDFVSLHKDVVTILGCDIQS